jgi:hypothetical protein
VYDILITGREELEMTHTWSDNKTRELIAVKVLHTSLLNITMVAFKVLPAPNPPSKTILELVLWNDLQRCRHITPHVISVIKMLSFIFGKREGVPAQYLFTS